MNVLRVLIADEDQSELSALAEIVRHLGHEVSAYAASPGEAATRIAEEDPAVALVALHEDTEHALALIEEISEYASGPVIAVIETEDPVFIRRAAELGIYAYARPSTPTSVQNAIEVAVRRRAEVEQLEERVGELEGALERRAVIERAKGILMERHGLDDRAAFELLREHARRRRMRVADLAASVSEGQALLPAG